MGRSRFAMDRMWWAVEKAGRWKAWKTKPRFSHAFHRPLENSQKRRVSHFSTAPTISPRYQNQGAEVSMKIRPDNSRVNKTGQLQKLTTRPPSSVSREEFRPSPFRAMRYGTAFASHPFVRSVRSHRPREGRLPGLYV